MGNFVTLGNSYSPSQILDHSRFYTAVVPKYVSDKNFKLSNAELGIWAALINI